MRKTGTKVRGGKVSKSTRGTIVKKPHGVKIGTLNYEVEYCSPLTDGDSSQLLYGHHMHSAIKIKIASDYPEERQRETFVHECLHAVDSRYCNDKLTEDQIACLSNGLFDWIRANPEAIDWVKGK